MHIMMNNIIHNRLHKLKLEFDRCTTHIDMKKNVWYQIRSEKGPKVKKIIANVVA